MALYTPPPDLTEIARAVEKWESSNDGQVSAALDSYQICGKNERSAVCQYLNQLPQAFAQYNFRTLSLDEIFKHIQSGYIKEPRGISYTRNLVLTRLSVMIAQLINLMEETLPGRYKLNVAFFFPGYRRSGNHGPRQVVTQNTLNFLYL